MLCILDLTTFYLVIVDVETIVASDHISHTVGKTSLVEGSVGRRDLYLTSHNTHKIQTSLFPAGFEPAIPASERPQTHVLDCAAAGMGGCHSFS